MDLFEDQFAGMVDLDDWATYPDDWKMLEPYALWRKAWTKAGESLFYMQFLHPEQGTSKQAYRVYRMCKELVDMRLEALLEATHASHLKVMKWLYRFENETENQV